MYANQDSPDGSTSSIPKAESACTQNGIFFSSWIKSTSPSFRYLQSRETAMETSVSNDAAGLSRRSNAKWSDTFSSLDWNRSSTNDGDIQNTSATCDKEKHKKNDLSRLTWSFLTAIVEKPVLPKPSAPQRYDDDEGETSVTPNCESEANIYNRSKSLVRFQQRFLGDKRSSGCEDFVLSFAADPSFIARLKDINAVGTQAIVAESTSLYGLRPPFYCHCATGNWLPHAQLYRLIEHPSIYERALSTENRMQSWWIHFLLLQTRNKPWDIIEKQYEQRITDFNLSVFWYTVSDKLKSLIIPCSYCLWLSIMLQTLL